MQSGVCHESLSLLIQNKERLIKRFTVLQGIYQNLDSLTFLIFLFTDSANYKNLLAGKNPWPDADLR